MRFILSIGIALSAVATAAVQPEPAFAGDATQGWGMGGNATNDSSGNASASLHLVEGQNAQIVTIGRDVTSMYRSVTSCGVCVYHSITGDRNSISGNSSEGSNSGDVDASGTFNQ
jgi:hypothetical protein